MSILLRLAITEEKPTLRKFLTSYLVELGQYGDVDFNYPYFDAYWSDNDRWPYLLEVDGQVAGFALINTWSPTQKGTDFAIAEFCIFPDFRRRGIGYRVFEAILQQHRGVWELSIMPENSVAKAFWQDAIYKAPVAGIEQIRLENALVYRFRTKNS